MSIQLDGLASGLEWQKLIDATMSARRVPQDKLKVQKEDISNKLKDFEALKSHLNGFKTVCDALKAASLFNGRTSEISDVDSKTVSVLASSQALTGSYNVEVKELATYSVLRSGSASRVAKSLTETSDVSGVMISKMPLATAIKEGRFTLNGKTIEVGSKDSLKDVFDKINTATSGDITASYDPTTDKIAFKSLSNQKISLGTSGDTSNFLQALKLYTNGMDTVESAGRLGTVQLKNSIENSSLIIKEGNFTINGKTIEVTSRDSLQSVFDKIKAATSGDVTASYDSETGKVTLEAKPDEKNPDKKISLGGLDDTSDFLAVLKLQIGENLKAESSENLGAINVKSTFGSSGLNLAATEGSFTINGREFSYKGNDSLESIINKVNGSDAGVSMFYDAHSDRFVLQNKQTGNLDIVVSDTSGNLMKSIGLSGDVSALTLGKNAEYMINGGQTLTSQSNSLGAASHGFQDLTITLKDKGTASFTVNHDPTDAKAKIKEFVDKFNDLQKFVKDKQKLLQDANGKNITGSFFGNTSVNQILQDIRKQLFGEVDGASSSTKRLAHIGVDFNAQGMLELKDAKLTSVLKTSPQDVAYLFGYEMKDVTKPNAATVTEIKDDQERKSEVERLFELTKKEGIAHKLDTFITYFTHNNFKTVKDSYESQTKTLDRKIEGLERQLQLQLEAEKKKYVKMEEMQSQLKAQLAQLQSLFR